MLMTPTTLIDGYKFGHRKHYHPSVTGVLANITPRTARDPGTDSVVFLGLQYFLQEYLENAWQREFFGRPKAAVVAQFARRVNSYLGPKNRVGTDHIEALHDLGYVPLRFRALPEGTSCPLRVPMLTVEETVPEFFWLVNYIESLLSCIVWGPTTSATTARRYRRILEAAAVTTGSPVEFVDWQGHDFSFRGMFGLEAACLSGLGHLLFFTGTDTVPALDFVEQYYGSGLPENYLIGGSVAATEHSVMCAGGQDGELETYSRLMDVEPDGILSVVSDTWDLWKVLEETLPALKNKIVARAGKLVIRPDSGDPVKIVCGDNAAPTGSPQRKGVVQLLWEHFGGTVNAQGFKVLDSHVGCIYGDSITPERAVAITAGLRANGFASENVVLGIGSYTYQHVTRDTYGLAMKSTWVRFDGQGRPIFKQPVTDDGVKNSARGRVAVLLDAENDKPYLVENATPEDEESSELRLVWENGRFAPGAYEGFHTIRARARGSV